MSIVSSSRVGGNSLLDQLPVEEYDALIPDPQEVSLTLEQIIHQCDVEVGHVYFPTTSLASLLIVLDKDDPIEAATVGREGLVGISAALGVKASHHRVICQMEGECLRLRYSTG